MKLNEKVDWNNPKHNFKLGIASGIGFIALSLGIEKEIVLELMKESIKDG